MIASQDCLPRRLMQALLHEREALGGAVLLYEVASGPRARTAAARASRRILIIIATDPSSALGKSWRHSLRVETREQAKATPLPLPLPLRLPLRLLLRLPISLPVPMPISMPRPCPFSCSCPCPFPCPCPCT